MLDKLSVPVLQQMQVTQLTVKILRTKKDEDARQAFSIFSFMYNGLR
jgi:hypothetical protein